MLSQIDILNLQKEYKNIRLLLDKLDELKGDLILSLTRLEYFLSHVENNVEITDDLPF